jgi:uncharacterized protein with PQ loop repeat
MFLVQILSSWRWSKHEHNGRHLLLAVWIAIVRWILRGIMTMQGDSEDNGYKIPVHVMTSLREMALSVDSMPF